MAAWFCAVAACLMTILVSPILVSPARGKTATVRGEPQFSKPISSRLNPTGRVLTLPMPLKDGKSTLGDVQVRIGADDRIEIAIDDFLSRTRRTLDDATRARLQAHSRSGSGAFVPLEAIVAAGVHLSFDTGLQELQIAPAVDQRQTGDISIAPNYVPSQSEALSRPAIWSGYLNVVAGLDHDWGTLGANVDLGGRESRSSGRLELESAVRLYDLVLENRALYEGSVDPFVCPIEARCDYGHGTGFKRESSRLVFDLPASRIRLQAGDTTAIGTQLQRNVDTLGFSIEKSDSKLAPGQARSASARQSLRIDRPSDVDVIVNGVALQRLQLRPGTYNIRDLPLATGANVIELAITDDAGVRRTESFTTFAGSNMLAPGAFEWALSGGLQSFLRDNARHYEGSEGAIATAFARYGLSENTTIETHAQGDQHAVMGGGGFVTETPYGVFGAGAAVSTGDQGTGYAGDVSWDLINYRGVLSERSESLRLAAEYRSKEFQRPGLLSTLASGVFYPEYNYWLRLSASYSLTLDWATTASLSGRYQFGDDEIARLTPFSFNGDRYGADLTLSRPFSPTVTGSLLIGYSNESFLRYALDNSETSNRDGAFRAALRFHIRPDDRTTVTAGYDTLDRLATVSGYRSHSDGVGRFDASADIHRLDATDRTTASGSIGYTGNRAEVRVSHNADLAGPLPGQSRSTTFQRSTLRIASSIAFADGVVAVGAPIRGNAFALIHPHASLASKKIVAGSFEHARAYADQYGPGVVGDLPAYSQTSIPIDVDGLPVGYSLGAGSFDILAHYKAGYALEIGSDASVSVYGTLVESTGEPVELASGYARRSNGGGKPIPVFTNAKGRFGAEGLSPGRWTIDVEADGRRRQFAIEIPDGTDGLFRAGTLRPEEAL